MKYTFTQEYLKKRRAILVISHIGEFFFKADIRIGSDVAVTHQTQSGWIALLNGLEQKSAQRVIDSIDYPINNAVQISGVDRMLNTSLVQIYQEGESIAFERFSLMCPTNNSPVGIYVASISAILIQEGLVALSTARSVLLTRESGVRSFSL